MPLSTTFSPLRARWLRWLGWAIAVCALLIGVAWLAVPPLVQAQLESRLPRALGRSTTVGGVAFDPFSLRLTIRKLAIGKRNAGGELFTADEIVANISSASLWHRAPVLDALKIVRPTLALARDAGGRLSVQDLIDEALAGPPEPPRFSLNNIEVDDGTISFDDGVTGRRHELAALDIGIPFLSSLPHQTEVRVTPRASGTFNGAHFALTGTTTPFATRREAALNLEVDALPLPLYVAYLPVKPAFELAGGALTTHLKLVFAGGGADSRRLELRGDAEVNGLALKRTDGTALAAAKRVAVTLDRIDLYGRDARVASVTIDTPTADVERLADGTLEWARLARGPAADTPTVAAGAASPGAAQPAPPAAVGAPAVAAGAPRWNAAIAKLAITGGTMALRDETSGFRSDLADVALEASNLSTRPGETAHMKAAFVSADRIASFAAEGDVQPTVPAASGHFALKGFSLGLLFPYYRSALAVEVEKGALDYASGFTLDAAGDLRLADGEATLRELRLALPGNREPLWRIPRLDLSAVDVDVPARTVAIGAAKGSGAALRLVRESDGTLEMARIFRTSATTDNAPPAAAAPRDGDAAGAGAGAAQGGAPAAGTNTWTLRAQNVALDAAAIDFEDRVAQPPVKLSVRDLAVTATGLTNARDAKSELTLRAALGGHGRVAFSGSVATNPLALDGNLTASGLALVPLKPYLEPRVSIVVTNGTLAAKGRLSVALPEHGPASAAWKGDATVSDFAALDRPTSSDLAQWKSLALDGLDLTAEPFRAAVSRIALADFDARAIVYSDGTLNFKRLLTPDADARAAAGPKQAAVSVRSAGGELPVSIGRIEFSGGSLDFSDYYIKPNYSTKLTEVHGSVSEMSPAKPGKIMLAAHIQGTSPVEVEGSIDPFAKELSLDLTGKARDIDLPPLTAYSAKYAGYGIERGKLRFDVHYKVENRRLTADNQIVLDQLQFGAKVDSPSATKLPVLLAVSLLKDSRGVIDLDLPISGSLDAPDFSVGGLIVKAIVNLIGKAATAPFALLGAAFGGGQELSQIDFAAGSAVLDDTAQKKIDTLAKALSNRPALELDLRGRADPSADRKALRDAAVEAALRRAKMKALAAAGEAPASLDDIVIGAQERPRWLAEAYRDARLPEGARSAEGAAGSATPAQMEAALRASIDVDDAALRALADARAQAVEDALTSKGVAAERLFLTAPHIGGGEEGGARTLARVDLALRTR